jgi:signal transduction histidine kinase
MALETTQKAPDLESANISEDLKKEIALFRALRPFLGQCLTLNHDLNNPLAGILGYAEFLQADKNLTDDQRKSLDQIVTCAERMRKLIEDLCEQKISLSGKVDMEAVTETLAEATGKSD